MDWSEWHPRGTVALDWRPHDIALHWHCIGIALSLNWHCFGIALALNWLPLDYHLTCSTFVSWILQDCIIFGTISQKPIQCNSTTTQPMDYDSSIPDYQRITTQPIHCQSSATLPPFKTHTIQYKSRLLYYQWITNQPIHSKSSATWQSLFYKSHVIAVPILCQFVKYMKQTLPAFLARLVALHFKPVGWSVTRSFKLA